MIPKKIFSILLAVVSGLACSRYCISDAAEHAAGLRFRAVLMTAVSFLLGTWPLVIASGAGAVSRRSLGTAVFGGMLISVLFGTLLIPVFYALVQKLIDRSGGKQTLHPAER